MHDDRHLHRLSPLASIPAWLAFGLACVAGLGYLSGNTALTAFQPGWKAMAPLTAIGIAALALPLMLVRPMRRRVAVAVAGSVCAAALAILAGHALFHGDVLHLALARLLGINAAMTGKTSVATGLCLLLLGGAGIARRQHALVLLELCANATLLIAGSALLGYAYGISDLYSYYVFNSMALPTALALFCLAVATLLAEPESRLGMAARTPHAGGRRARRMLALTALPAALGWLLLNVRAGASGPARP
jgi:hypothetical protein